MGGGGSGRLFEVGANSRLGAYSNKYGKWKAPSASAFFAREAITRPGYQASEASNATDEFFIIVKPGGSTLL